MREGLRLESGLFSNSVGGMRGRGDHKLQDGGDGGDRDSGRGCIVSAHTCTLTPTHMHADTYHRSGNFHSKNISSLDGSTL